MKTFTDQRFTNHLQRIRLTVQIDTQRIRGKVLKHLEGVFDLATNQAKNEKLDPASRQKWTHAAGYVAQVMNSVAAGFDEKQIDTDLNELERMINEARAIREKRSK